MSPEWENIHNSNAFSMFLATRIHKKSYSTQKKVFLCENVRFTKKYAFSGGKCIPDAKMHFLMESDFLWIHGARNIKIVLGFCSVSSKCPTKYVLSLKMCCSREKCRLSVQCEFVVKKWFSCGFGDFCSGIAFLWEMSASKDFGSHMYPKSNLRSGSS